MIKIFTDWQGGNHMIIILNSYFNIYPHYSNNNKWFPPCWFIVWMIWFIFSPHFFSVGWDRLFLPFFFSLSPIIISTTPILISYHHYLPLHHLTISWRPRHCTHAVAAGLHNNNIDNSSPPPPFSIYSSSSSTSSSLYIPIFYLTSSPHQHYFPTSSTYNPFNTIRR